MSREVNITFDGEGPLYRFPRAWSMRYASQGLDGVGRDHLGFVIRWLRFGIVVDAAGPFYVDVPEHENCRCTLVQP